MKKIGILFPHQLFENHQILEECDIICLVEEYLFFNQYTFHKQKLAFHRASMKSYEQLLLDRNKDVKYVSSQEKPSDIRILIQNLAQTKENLQLHFIDPTDEWLARRIKNTANSLKLETVEYENPAFLNTRDELKSFFKPEKQSFFQTTFYKQQRKKLGILLDQDGKPEGGKWTYDTENRKKYPKGKTPPPVNYPEPSEIWDEAVNYVEQFFGKNPGQIKSSLFYPLTHTSAKAWFHQFLEYRFHDFGHYEDAIVSNESILNHSLISPLLNSGLLDPTELVLQSLSFADSEKIPLNSSEGFIRQIIGWREFIRGMYENKGNWSRTRNFWNFKRKIPESFYNGNTGIEPIDITIRKVLKTGYAHHIERLMVLGNFMLLCEFDPDEVYRWFMELFIDAYDWVMVPNIYGMSQFADGGLFATKPYISSSNYLMKMSNYTAGEWQHVWDGLFWRFIHKHYDFFKSNPRTSMLVYSYKRMSDKKRNAHIAAVENFISNLK